jgi:hypothetical protein
MPLLRKRGSFVLVEKYQGPGDDTLNPQYVALSTGSPTATIQNVELGQEYVGAAFYQATNNTVYRILAITVNSGDTIITLDNNWLGDDIVVGDEAVCLIAQDRYTLPVDFDRPVTDWKSFFAPYGIQAVDPNEFQRRRRTERASRLDTGESRFFTIYGMNAAQTAQVAHFDPWPDEARVIQFEYQQLHPIIDSDNDKLLFPRKFIEVIVEMVLQLAYRDYEDDARMQQTLGDMLRSYNQMMASKDVTSAKLILRPDGRTRQAIYKGARWGGRRIDWREHFDKTDNVGFF